MIKQRIDDFTEDICRYNNFTDEQTEEIKYVTKIAILEIIKMVIIIFLFSLFGYFKEVLLIVTIMFTVKPFTGGYHEDTQRKCLVATITLVLFIIVLYEQNNLNLISIILLNMISLFATYHQAPIVNKDMPITRTDLLQKNRKIAMINSTIFFIISLILYQYKGISNIITWTLVLNTCLMFNSKIGRE